jgi:hypothetical protein
MWLIGVVVAAVAVWCAVAAVFDEADASLHDF